MIFIITEKLCLSAPTWLTRGGAVENYELYQKRLVASGKISKEKLMELKLNTFKKALSSSYNAETVVLNDSAEFKALVSNIPTSPKIDEKNFATLVEHGCEIGDVIYRPEVDSFWLISKRDDAEPATFQGVIMKSLYVLKWKDPETNEIYTSRASVKGPDETVISEGVKHSIIYTRPTDSLYLIVPIKAKGSHLLRKNFELMVDGRKWSIQVADRYTHKDDFVYLQLLEESFDRDADTEEVAGGKNEYKYEVKSVLDDLTSVSLDSQVIFKPVLFRNGISFSQVLNVECENCEYQEGVITFSQEGSTVVRVRFADYDYEFVWEVEVVAEVAEDVLSREIIGADSIKTLGIEIFEFVNVVNGVAQPLIGEWNFDENYFTLEEIDGLKVKLKTKNKTGATNIMFSFEEDEEIKSFAKEVKIIPLFGR